MRIDRIGKFATLALFGALPFAHPAQAGERVVAGNGLHESVSCDGGDGVLRGNDNDVAFTGSCRSLLLEGNGNVLRAAAPAGAGITVRGNDNRVYYRAEGGEAQLQMAGRGNVAHPTFAAPPTPAAPEADAPLILREENARRALDCAGRDVLVEGNGDDYTLRGGCRSLTVRGEGVRIRVEMAPGGRIGVQGNGDAVSWSLSGEGPEPSTSLDGEGSRITRAAHAGRAAGPFGPASHGAAIRPPPAPEPSRPPAPAFAAVPPPPAKGGKLTLRGDHEARDVECAGRDVRIDGDYGLYVLRGGCRSITVKGDSNKVQAELLAGARIVVNGAGDAVAYVSPGDAQAVVNVTGEHDQVKPIPQLGYPPELGGK